MNKTYIAKQKEKTSVWFFVDAKDKTLGRLSTQVARALKNKYSIYYAPHEFIKSYVIIVNASLIKVSGQKKYQKIYRRHSGRPGGLKEERLIDMQKRMPARVIEKAIKGMLPKNALGRKLFTNLKVYPSSSHPHEAQKPIPLPI